MKKFKSLFSLMLVMILMLSMAGPMAFAEGPDGSEANPYQVTITARNPYFDMANNKYVANGYTIINSNTNADLVAKGVVPSSLKVSVALNAEGSAVTTTPVIEGAVGFNGDNGYYEGFCSSQGYYYQISEVVPGAVSKPAAVVVEAKAPVFNAEGNAVGAGLVSDGVSIEVPGHGTVAAIISASYAEPVYGTDTVTIMPKDVKLVAGGNDISNVVSDIILKEGTYTKEVITIDLNDPIYNGTEYVVNMGNPFSYTPAAPTVSVNGTATSVTPVIAEDKYVVSGEISGANATVSVNASDVAILSNGVDFTKAFKVVVDNGVLTKQTINVYPRPAKQNADGTFSADGFADDSHNVTGSPVVVSVTEWIIDSTGAIQAANVIVKDANTGADVTAYFNVVRHKTAFNGTTTNPGGTTNPTGVVLKTASNSWIYDGQPHSYAQFDPTTIPSGWTVSGGTFSNSITNVGTIANTVDKSTLVVKDASGNVVTNYSVEAGTLTITKRPLTIQATSAGKTPNGYAFSEKDAKGVKFANSTSLVAGHSIGDGLKIQYVLGSTTYTDYKQVTASGTYIKDLVAYSAKVVVDAYGNDMTYNYDINTIDGTLTISSGWVSPDTGDHSNIGLWIALLAASAVAVAAVVFVVLKKGKKA